METVSRIFFLLPLVLSIAHGPNQVFADNIAQACEDAVNEQLCIKNLQADPASKSADLAGLATIAVKLAVANATSISESVKKMLTTSKDSFELKCLKDCDENYLAAIDQLQDTLAALHSKGYHDATTWIQAAMTDSETCEDCFAEKPGFKNQLTDENTNFQQLCGNALAIANVLHGIGSKQA